MAQLTRALRRHVGQRYPLVPPLGVTLVAWSSTGSIQHVYNATLMSILRRVGSVMVLGGSIEGEAPG
jgi:hypothetical protein